MLRLITFARMLKLEEKFKSQFLIDMVIKLY